MRCAGPYDMNLRSLVGIGLLLGASALAGCVAAEEGASDATDALSGDRAAGRWSTEEGLPERFQATIKPRFLQETERGEFVGVDGIKIRYARWPAPREKAALVIVNGRTESYIKYAEVADDLHRHGYSLYLVDHRGQGFSDRMLPDHDKGHVNHFSDYVTDLEELIDTVVKPRSHERLFALGHSMGAAILAEYTLEHPDTFRAVVFNAPMFQIAVPFWLGELGVTALNSLKEDTDYVVGKGPYAVGGPNVYQHSAVRFALFFDALAQEFPQTRVGGPTKRWLSEAMTASADIRTRAAELRSPTLVLEAELDAIVDNAGAETVCVAAPACKKVVIAGGGHELLMEKDDLRGATLDAIVEFVDSH